MELYWDIDEGKIDSTVFFRLLLKYFPDATTFFAEGTVIETDVVECYKRHIEDGGFLPGAQTIFPRSKKFRCKFSEAFINEIADLSELHAEPELLDHLFLYKDDKPILLWHDAFANAILVSRSVSEDVISSFASELGLKYGEANFG
jgi:hypothetical protein